MTGLYRWCEQGDRCGVWQHSACVGVDPSSLPERHLCDWCRITKSDPFWVPITRKLLPPFVLRATPGRAPAYLTPGERVRAHCTCRLPSPPQRILPLKLAAHLAVRTSTG